MRWLDFIEFLCQGFTVLNTSLGVDDLNACRVVVGGGETPVSEKLKQK